MAISKNCTITIKDDIANIDSPISIYQDDRGLSIYFEILDIGLREIDKQNLIISSSTTYSTVRLKSPNGELILSEDRYQIYDDKIKFVITQELTDELDEVGMYTMQIHLWDDMENRITIPPITFEVKALI